MLCLRAELRQLVCLALLAIGGELSKRQGVLFHWWSLMFKAKRELLVVLPRYKVNMNFKHLHHILVGCLFEKMFH